MTLYKKQNCHIHTDTKCWGEHEFGVCMKTKTSLSKALTSLFIGFKWVSVLYMNKSPIRTNVIMNIIFNVYKNIAKQEKRLKLSGGVLKHQN